MDEMKGRGRTLLRCLTVDQRRVALVRFRDGSLAIRVNGRTVGVFEPPDEEAGVCEFLLLSGLEKRPGPGEPPHLILFQAPPGSGWLN